MIKKKEKKGHIRPPLRSGDRLGREHVCNTLHLVFGFWVLGFGFRILDFGFWVLGCGFWVLGFGFWVLGFGFLVCAFCLLDWTSRSVRLKLCSSFLLSKKDLQYTTLIVHLLLNVFNDDINSLSTSKCISDVNRPSTSKFI